MTNEFSECKKMKSPSLNIVLVKVGKEIIGKHETFKYILELFGLNHKIHILSKKYGAFTIYKCILETPMV